MINLEEQSPSFGPFETFEIQFAFYQSIRLSGLTGLTSLTSAIPFAPSNLIYTLSGAQSWINIAADTSSNEAILTFIEPECGEFSFKITATYYDYQSESKVASQSSVLKFIVHCDADNDRDAENNEYEKFTVNINGILLEFGDNK